jgi:hypothetical protein
VKLPNAERAVADVSKLRDYSLNAEHPKGKHKARVFRAALGLAASDAEALRRMIIEAVLVNEATEQAPNSYGRRFVVDFRAPSTRGPVIVRSTWLIRNDEEFPRLTNCFIP